MGSKDDGNFWRVSWGNIGGRKSRRGRRRVRSLRGRLASGLNEKLNDVWKRMMNFTYDGNPLFERWPREQLRQMVRVISIRFASNLTCQCPCKAEKSKITHSRTSVIKRMKLSSKIER